MTEVLQNLHEQKLKAYRLQQLLDNKDKSAEEIKELNELVEEISWAKEMRDDPEYTEMIRDFTSGYFYSEDVDFVIGTLYGISAQGILKKEMDDEKKKKMLKACANMWFDIRNEAIKELNKKMHSAMEQPKPYKP